VYLRFIAVTINEVIIFMIIASYDFGSDLSFGLVVNFSSALIISQFSSLVVNTGRIKKLETYFNIKYAESLNENNVDYQNEFYKRLSQPRFLRT
jgi:hypothetical protein